MRPDTLTLGFDTSAAHCAAALLSGDRVIVSRTETMDKGQAERLIPLLEEVLADAGAGWRDLSALGVGVGPGNFTGIRIAVSAARGLALSLSVPAVGVHGFEALALGHDGPVLCSLDARRGDCWLARPEAPAGAIVAAPDTLPEDFVAAHGGLAVTGHRASDLAARLGGTERPGPANIAEAIARLAADRSRGRVPRPAPLYLRNADAAPPADPPPVILP